MEPISSEALRQFLLVASERDLHSAARRLRRDVIALRDDLNDLERTLDSGPLLILNPDGVELTGAGQALRASLIAVARIQSGNLAPKAIPAPSRRLRLGLPSAPVHALIPRILQRFREQHPDAGLSLREATTDSHLRALENDELDLCFVHPPGHPTRARLEPLVDETLCVLLPPRHPLLTLDTVALPVLASEGFILPPPGTADGFVERVLALCEQAGFQPRITQQAFQLPTIAGLVAAGLGVAIVPGQPGEATSLSGGVRPLTLTGHGEIARVPLLMAYTGEHDDLLAPFLRVARRLMPSRVD